MATKTYLVQTWDSDGALKNHYEVTLPGPSEVAALKKFLKGKFAHVTIVPAGNAPKQPRRKR